MTTELTIQNLIRHFENRLHQIDRENLGDALGKEPQYPQLVVYLGKDASEAHSTLSSGLLQTWPQYEKELKFLLVENKGSKLEFQELVPESDEGINCSDDGVRELVSALFGTRMHFQDRSKLLVYYILDTTSFCSSDSFSEWIEVIAKFRKIISADSTDLLDMLILLLNENHVRQRTASIIRNELSGFYTGNAVKKNVSTVLLVSNRRSDHAILEDWEMAYKVIAATISISNNSDARVTGSIFCNAILTASYARAEKPLPQIGQTVVRKLLGELEANIPKIDTKLLDDPKLPEKLGLSKNGNFTLLDQFAETHLYPLLPTEAQLELFPRRDDASQMSMANMPAKAFNEYTMGSWGRFLASIAEEAREKVAMNSAIRQQWSEEYRKHLVAMFNKEEILYLADRLDDVSDVMSKSRMPSQEATVLTAAKDQLKYMLSSDVQLINIFVDALKQQGQVATDFSQAWAQLLKSRRQIHEVRDNNITTFYEKKVRNFFDRHGAEVGNGFVEIHETPELVRFLQGALEDIIDSDDIFSAAFEDELETRLNEDSMPTDAKQYIRNKLTGSEVYTYLQTNFALGEPVVSSILLKIGTKLYKNLHGSLAPETYYYNTGNSNAAEALVLFEVSRENLVSGEVV